MFSVSCILVVLLGLFWSIRILFMRCPRTAGWLLLFTIVSSVVLYNLGMHYDMQIFDALEGWVHWSPWTIIGVIIGIKVFLWACHKIYLYTLHHATVSTMLVRFAHRVGDL